MTTDDMISVWEAVHFVFVLNVGRWGSKFLNFFVKITHDLFIAYLTNLGKKLEIRNKIFKKNPFWRPKSFGGQ